MLPSKQESDCRVIEMSPGNVAIETSKEPTLGDEIVLYIAKLGRFSSRVERVVPFVRRTILKLADGREAIARIADVSCVGVGVETELRPANGGEIMVGKTLARVVRHFAGGFACSIITPFEKAQIDESAVL